MWRLFNHAIQCLCALPGWIEIVHHKPQEKPVPYVALLRISERWPMVIASWTGRAPVMKTQQDRGVLIDNLIED